MVKALSVAALLLLACAVSASAAAVHLEGKVASKENGKLTLSVVETISSSTPAYEKFFASLVATLSEWWKTEGAKAKGHWKVYVSERDEKGVGPLVGVSVFYPKGGKFSIIIAPVSDSTAEMGAEIAAYAVIAVISEDTGSGDGKKELPWDKEGGGGENSFR